MTIIASFFLNTSFRAPPPPTPTSTSAADILTTFRSNASNSTAVAVRPSTNLAVIPEPFYNRGSTPPVSSPQTTASLGLSKSSNTRAATFSEKMNSSKDVIVRPPATVSEVPPLSVKPTTPLTITQPTESKVETAISLKMADAVSEILDATKKAVMVFIENDIREIVDALDLLMQSIRKQVDIVANEAQSLSKYIQSQFQYRNERAKKQAHMLVGKGSRALSYAQETIKKRTRRARARARSLSETVLKNEDWEDTQKDESKDEGKGKEKKGYRDKAQKSKRVAKKARHGRHGSKPRKMFSG
jgi:hypothetical protein